MNARKFEIARLGKYAKQSAVVGAVALTSQMAFAAGPDTTQAIEAIKGISTSTDAVGNTFITVIVGIVVFGFIIGMLWRKGK